THLTLTPASGATALGSVIAPQQRRVQTHFTLTPASGATALGSVMMFLLNSAGIVKQCSRTRVSLIAAR
ncbi:MAG TPA: hypothetical protein VGO68_10860, partial [Pyrinomonadaceae bacterium]|nr:hypothetical protein [Pyrinomonadaceae bacterium]